MATFTHDHRIKLMRAIAQALEAFEFDRVFFFGWSREAREFARQCRFGFEEFKMQGRPYLMRVKHSNQVRGFHPDKAIYCYGSAPYYFDNFEREAEDICRHRYRHFEKSKILELAKAKARCEHAQNKADGQTPIVSP